MSEWTFEVGDSVPAGNDTNDHHHPDGSVMTFGDYTDNAGGGAGGDDDGGHDRPKTCNNCGQEGHFKRECPEISDSQRGACFNCGEQGHNKAECPNPRVFSGTCRICYKEGHPAKDCPDKPSEICKNCKEEGHRASECKNARKIDMSLIPSVSPEHAWNQLEDASKARDLDDMREAFGMYAKACSDATYHDMEESFRKQGLKFYIIAFEREVDDIHTVMDLQGNLGKKYVIGFFLSPKCPRKSLVNSWPSSPEENMERLKDAGVIVDAYVTKCSNCGELGHSRKVCTQEKADSKPEMVCSNCDEPGHRMRDCPNPRKDRFACRNCNKRGHDSRACPEPPNPANVMCKNCEKRGHFARDCPDRPPEKCNNCGEEGHRAKECSVTKCRNCDAVGHISKDCPKPRDYSRVKCMNCGEMGHTKVRCKQPPKEDDDAFGEGGGPGAFDTSDSFGGGGFNTGFNAGDSNKQETFTTNGDGEFGW